MSKKSLVWFTALTLGLTSAVSIGGGVSVAKTSADFSDLKDLDAATKAKFDALIQAGVFDGVSQTSFGLQENMNRAQFAKVAALIFNLKVDSNLQKSSFDDVKSDDPANGYALPYIEAVRAAGITAGVGNGQFDPTGQVTKEQLAAFMIRGLGLEAEARLTPGVSDNTVSDWAKGYVHLVLKQKLLNNSSDGTFGGREETSRALLATGSFESAKVFEATRPLEVSGANFAAGNKLELSLTIQIDANSVDLSKIKINGVPLDPKLDSYVLSEDKKTIIIKLHKGFKLDTSKPPVIVVDGLKTLFGNVVKNEGSKPIPVKVTEPPVTPQVVTNTPSDTTPSTPTPTPTPLPDVTLTIDRVNAIITQTTASYQVKGSVTGTVYYSVLPSDSAVPSLDAIKLGTNAVVYGSVELDGTKGNNLDLSGLTAGTSYMLYAYEVANNRISNIASIDFRTMNEQQYAPSITFNDSGTSRIMGSTSDAINASVNLNGSDTLYYVLTESSVSPSAAKVKSGQDETGKQALHQGKFDTDLQEFNISISKNLLPNKTYHLYVVGSKVTLDSKVAGFTFFRTDSIIDMFTSMGTPIVSLDSVTVSPDYSGSDYQFYYLTTDQFKGVNPPSADYIINQGRRGEYVSTNGTVRIQDSFTSNTGLYAVIVAYNQELDDYIRSEVVAYIPTP